MTFHHFNRFIDHNSTQLTPSELALALYICQLIRDKTNLYSASVRRISQHLGLSPAGVKRSLKGLEDKGIFKVSSSYLSTYAKSYELAIICPDNCPFEDHLTKQELAKLAEITTRRIKHAEDRVQIDPPYIELKEEEDVLVSFEGEEELGLLVQVLKEGSLTEDGEKILEATQSHPRSLAKALVQIATKAKLDSPKRKRTYFEKIVKQTPLTLLKTFEDTKALEIGRQLLAGAEETAFKVAEGKPAKRGNQLPRAHSWKRLNLWLKEFGFKLEEESFYLTHLASEGLLEEKHLVINNEILKALDDNLLTINFGSKKASWRDYLQLHANEEDHRPELRAKQSYLLGELGRVINLTQDLLTAEELPAYELREAKLLELKAEFLKHHTASSLPDFYRSETMGKFLMEHPEPLDLQTKAQRFLDKVNLLLGTMAEQSYAYTHQENGVYQSWLEQTFTWEDDLKEVLEVIPARLEGHNPHLKKFEEAYKEVRAKLAQNSILALLTDYGRSSIPEPNKYALTPDKYLLEKLKHRL